MFNLKAVTTATVASAALLALASGSALAGKGYGNVIDASMSRIGADTPSGDKVSTVRNNCGGGTEGWDGATATVEVAQANGGSNVEVEVKGAKPDTVFTVWVRVKGKSADGSGFGGSPLTGGGATPLAPGSDLDTLIGISPWNNAAGSNDFTVLTNGFRTDADGDGEFEIDIDFPVVRGAYPFNKATLSTPTGVAGFPVAIHNPAEPGTSSAFLFRVVSHCQDDSGHGLSPGKREAWFQYP